MKVKNNKTVEFDRLLNFTPNQLYSESYKTVLEIKDSWKLFATYYHWLCQRMGEEAKRRGVTAANADPNVLELHIVEATIALELSLKIFLLYKESTVINMNQFVYLTMRQDYMTLKQHKGRLLKETNRELEQMDNAFKKSDYFKKHMTQLPEKTLH